MEILDQDLVIDVGNTRLKAALFADAGPVRSFGSHHGDLEGLRQWLGPARPRAVVLASVAAPDAAFEAGLAALGPLLVLNGASPSPLRSAYRTPLTLGLDRLANAVGAVSLFPGRTVIAVDLGTCITYDVVDAEGRYSGGLITPGMLMRARAMNAYSARLPLVSPTEVPPLIGLDTAGCLLAGVHHGVRAELQGLIADLGQGSPDHAVVLTGGDALRFAKALKNGIFADPLLTLRGSHALLLHHRSMDPVPPPAGAGAAGGGPDRR